MSRACSIRCKKQEVMEDMLDKYVRVSRDATRVPRGQKMVLNTIIW